MGILNLTPDSFYDGGFYTEKDAWISQTEKMIHDGASVIDIGAVSTRPAAAEVSEDEEISRLMPALETLVKLFPDMIFSVDTYRSSVAWLAAQAGAGMINDISGGAMDEGMINTVAKTGLPYILMHIQGTPSTMQLNPYYSNVTLEVIDYFNQKINTLQHSGINQILLDPGFGFGKSIEHNYQLLRELSSLKQPNYPILVGLSRKSMIYKLLDITPHETLPATTALNMMAVINGANILRVHDVKEAIQAIKLSETYLKAKE